MAMQQMYSFLVNAMCNLLSWFLNNLEETQLINLKFPRNDNLEDLGSTPGPVIPKTLKMVPDASLLDTQQYKVRIKGKVEQSRERSSALPDTLV